ncbi:hypothetical protein B0H15DRAFT_465488 [Mycena belliarum]|uniref:F-box domain-containing protein n=1 Tax=Mycena belliarum TaxID=1033014 RepID=A0AAD6Y0I4_9AGAR|nr:hypothetical protein B0H15DRAFT_465488 [Mycena belliae]
MGEFGWITPRRRIGARVLSLIPTEVYLEIFSYLEPSEEASPGDSRRIFTNLAPVCRFFCAHSISRMYRSLEFSGRDASSGSPSFCRLLLKGDSGADSCPAGVDFRFALQVAQSVRECTFRDWLDVPSASSFLKYYSKAVGHMPNIVCFHLETTPITLPLIQAIARYKLTATKSAIRTNLAELSIHSCILDTSMSERDVVDLSLLALRNVEHFATWDIPPAIIRVRQLEVFRTDSWDYASYFIKRKHPDLRVLELHRVEDVSAVFAFLTKCPSITELTIGSVFTQSLSPLPSLAVPALPQIHALHVPPVLLRYFAERPLRKVSLGGAELRVAGPAGCPPSFPTLPLLTLQDVLPLKQSTAQITELHVHQHIYFLFLFHKHFKALEVLTLAYHHPNFATVPAISSAARFESAIRAICSRWPSAASPPPLRALHLDFGATDAADLRSFLWDLRLQHELISSVLCTAFPRLTRVAFARFLTWQRGDAQADSAWRAFVPHRFRGFVCDKLARGAPYTDVSGCLAALDFKY